MMDYQIRMGFLRETTNVGRIGRFQHPAYHFAMLSFFVTMLQLLEFGQYKIYHKIFILLNTIIQAYSILIANYRAAIIATAFFLLFSSLIILFSRRGRKFYTRTFLIIALFCGVIFLFSDVIFAIPWFARIVDTKSILNDPNMAWRIVELLMAISRMNTWGDYILGMGYGRPFPYAGELAAFLHNGFVSIFYNFGVIGSILMLNIWANFYIYIRRYLRPAHTPAYYITITYFIALMIQNWSSGIFNREEAAIISFILFLLVVVFYSRELQRRFQGAAIALH
jgi:hypothetical protein